MADPVFDPRRPSRSRAETRHRNEIMADRLRRLDAEGAVLERAKRAFRMEQEARRQLTEKKEATMVRWVGGHETPPPPSMVEDAEAEENARQFREERARIEREAGERERGEQLIAFYRRGGDTDKMTRLREYISYLNMLREGGWQSANSEWASRGTVQDDARALTAVGDAARTAVAETLKVFIEQAEKDLEAATAERAEIIRRGHF